MRTLLFIIILLLGGVVPLFAHPIIIIPDWFGTAILVIFFIIYFLIMWVTWNIKFLRYFFLLLLIGGISGNWYLGSDFYSEMREKKYIKQKENKVYALSQIDKAWEIINKDNQVLTLIKGIDKHLKEDDSEVQRKISALHLALYIQNPEKYKNYKKILSLKNFCYVLKEALTHIEIENEIVYTEIYSELEQRNNTNIYQECMPINKPNLIEQSIRENKMDVSLKLFSDEHYTQQEVVSILKKLKRIKDEDIQKKMITSLLKNYRHYMVFYSFQEEIESILEDVFVYVTLQDTKGFDSYIDIMTNNLKEVRKNSFEEGLSETKRDSTRFLVKKYTKKQFLNIKSILGENSPLIEEIPSYIREHFSDENPTEYAEEGSTVSSFDEYWIVEG